MYTRARSHQTENLGQWGEIAAAVIGSQAGGGGGAGGGAGGPSPAAAPRPDATTISPAFQQSFTPQISPVFQQTQDSPGATQAATTVQRASGGQSAKGGGTSTGIPGLDAPGASDFPNPPQLSTFERDFQYPDAVREVFSPKGFDWTPVIWIGGFVTVAVVASMFLKDRNRKARP